MNKAIYARLCVVYWLQFNAIALKFNHNKHEKYMVSHVLVLKYEI
jgi:hypothetical protein